MSLENSRGAPARLITPDAMITSHHCVRDRPANSSNNPARCCHRFLKPIASQTHNWTPEPGLAQLLPVLHDLNAKLPGYWIRAVCKPLDLFIRQRPPLRTGVQNPHPQLWPWMRTTFSPSMLSPTFSGPDSLALAGAKSAGTAATSVPRTFLLQTDKNSALAISHGTQAPSALCCLVPRS
jgi:hypothetical protein